MNIRKDLKPTDDIQEQIKIGKAIAEGYDQAQLDFVKKEIYKTKDWGQVSMEDMVYISIYDYWVYGFRPDQQLYYHLLGKKHEEKLTYMTMMEDFVYYARLNRKADFHKFEDKYEAYCNLKPYYGREIIKVTSMADYEVFKSFVSRHPQFVLKPIGLHDTYGIEHVDITKVGDVKKYFESIIKVGHNFDNDYYTVGADHDGAVCEEIIEQAPSFSVFSPKSVSIIRVPTVRVNGKVTIYGAYTKIGASDDMIVGESRNAYLCGVDCETGELLTNGCTEDGKEYEYHPVSGVKFKGFKFQKWDELKSMLYELASNLEPTINYVGWDVVLTPKGWVLVEGNFYGMSLWQIAYGRGMRKEFGDLIGWHMDDDKFWWQYKIRQVEKSAGLE